MQTLIIKRVATGHNGTFGTIEHRDIPFALTLERQWLNNRSNVSCIPEGNYKCKRVQSPKFGNTFEVTNVPHRTHILFHKGNLDDDSHGCILLGEQFEPLNGSPGILSSKKAFAEFTKLLASEDQFNLVIINCWNNDFYTS